MGKGSGIALGVSGWWLVSAPVDFRGVADRLLVHVRETSGRDPFEGSAYVFCNRRTTRLKVLVIDAQGVWLCVRRHWGRLVLVRLGPGAVVAHADAVRVAVRRGALAAFVM